MSDRAKAPEAPSVVIEPEILPPLEVTISAETQLIAMAERSFLSTIQKHGDDAKRFLEQRADLMSTARVLGLRATRPEDWILTKDKQGLEIAMLAGPGADQVANLFGVQILNIRPLDARGIFQPERIVDESDPKRFTLRAWCDAFSHVTGRAVHALEASRRSDEDFTGRSVDAGGAIVFRGDGALESDLRAAVQTLLRTKAVRVLAGMTRVPVSELRAAGLDIARCRKGHGYGSATDRNAESVTEGDVKVEAKKLGEEILRRTSGDAEAAKQVLREITINKDGKYARDSVAQFTKAEQVKWAWERLAKHPQFGDQAGGRNPGEE